MARITKKQPNIFLSSFDFREMLLDCPKDFLEEHSCVEN
jgi:hypothetical protein